VAEGVLSLAESKNSVFGGEKRERVEEVEREVFPVVGGRREEWVFKEVSGKGDWRAQRNDFGGRGGRGGRGGVGSYGRFQMDK